MAFQKSTRALIEALESRRLLSTYYVSPTGSDSAAGGISTPFKTLQHAADQVVAGDTVNVSAGTYAGWVMGWDSTPSGTANAPITFHADPGATINSRNSKTADGINLEPGCNYIIIEGFTVNNASGNITRAGIRVVGSNHVVVRNNVTDHNGTWGIFTSFADDILIENNIASHSISQHGIYFSNSGDRPIIRGNTVFGNNDCGIHMNGDISQGGDGIISGALVENNIIYDNGVGGGSGINCDGVQDSIFRNNLLYNNHAGGITLYDIDAAQPSKNNLIVNNTVLQASDGRWAVNITDGSTGVKVFNNVLYNYHSFRGSINVMADSLSGFQSDYNVVMDRFSTDGGDSLLTLAQWRSAHGQDIHSKIATPAQLFVNTAGNDYHLSATSPALDAGTSTNAPTKDLEGNGRPSGVGFDIGAYEKQVSGGGGGTTGGTWQQTAQADFNAGSRSGTIVTNSAGGEIQLAPSFSDQFTSSTLSSAWSSKAWKTGGKATASGGILSVSGTQVRTVQKISGVPVEGSIKFAAAAGQDFGLASNLSSAKGNYWATFSTRTTTTTLFARVNVAGSIGEINLGGIPSGFHTYRVQPGSQNFTFYIDGVLKATINQVIPSSVTTKLVLSATQKTPALQADSVQVVSFASGGTFTSSVFNAGRTATWGLANWSANLPTGTSLIVETSSGNTATPDASWTTWVTVTNGATVSSPAGQYIRYRVTFVTSNSKVTPSLLDLSIQWS